MIHLAAQAGVRYSFENPDNYMNSNIIATYNLLEYFKNKKQSHFVYASSSSVYGNSEDVPFHPEQRTDRPVSLYAATKKSCEVLTHSYAHNFSMQTTALRFFTVYGPWGRPDMAPFKFVKSMIEDKEISVFNNGDMKRDFTFVGDIVEAVYRVTLKKIDNKESNYRIFNIGRGKPVELKEFIQTIEEILSKKAQINYQPMQPGDVYQTFADTSDLEKYIDFSPRVSLKEGLTEFINWYQEYYK